MGEAPVPAPPTTIHHLVISGLKLRDAVLLVGGHQTNQTKRSEMGSWEVSGCFCCFFFFNLQKKMVENDPVFERACSYPKCLSCNLFVWIFPPPKVWASTSSPSSSCRKRSSSSSSCPSKLFEANKRQQNNLQQHGPRKSQLLPKV